MEALATTSQKMVPFDWIKVCQALSMLPGAYEAQIAKLQAVKSLCGWAVPVFPGITCSKVIRAMEASKLTVYVDGNPDVIFSQNVRTPANGFYAVRFAGNVEADLANINQSPSQRREKGCTDTTLLERLLLGFAYFKATGENLDTVRTTLCVASSTLDHRFACVHSPEKKREIIIHWFRATEHGNTVAAREVAIV